MNYVRYDNTLMKRQTSGQTDPGLFTSGNLQGFIADLCIQRIPVCSKKPVELYFADYRRQLFIRTGSLLIKITPDRIVENINLLRHHRRMMINLRRGKFLLIDPVVIYVSGTWMKRPQQKFYQGSLAAAAFPNDQIFPALLKAIIEVFQNTALLFRIRKRYIVKSYTAYLVQTEILPAFISCQEFLRVLNIGTRRPDRDHRIDQTDHRLTDYHPQLKN